MQTFSINYFNKMAEEVRREGLDAILIAPSEDLLFITGHNPIFCERFQGLFVKADGEYFYVCNLLTKDEMEAILPNKKVYAWFDGDGFQTAVRQALEENGLIGKTIGYSGTRFGEVAVGQMLETVGATLDDVELIDVGFDLMSAMTTGNVDATFGCFINHEVPALEEEGFAVDYMEVMDYGVPNYYALMLVTGEDQLEANRDKYTRFLRACQKGFADMQADPEEALGLLLANQDEENFPLTESVERRSFDVLLPIMETADAPFLSQDVSVWEENIDWLQKVGMIDAAFDPAEVMVDLLAE